MPLISIIIPVFKVENYLKKCVNSVLNQSFPDIEVILVNDGSPDNCPSICDEFSRLDTRVRVIHKSNGGLSDARNEGIKAAVGEYLMFLDSDDYWEGNNCLVNLVDAIKTTKSDIILYGAEEVYLQSNAKYPLRGSYETEAIQKSKEEAIKSLFRTNHFPGSAWILAIRRSLVLEKRLYFVVGLKAEDIDWLISVFINANTFDAVNDPFYRYVKNREGAITTTSDSRSVTGILYSVNKWTPILEKSLTTTNRLLLSYLAYQYITAYITFSKISRSEKKKFIKDLDSNKRILKYATGKRSICSKYLISTVGTNISAFIFNNLYNIINTWPALKKVM